MKGHSSVSRLIDAPAAVIYGCFLDPVRLAQWRVPPNMTARVHVFDGRLHGGYRMSLTYDRGEGVGKSADGTDSFTGVFSELVPDRKIVERIGFETDDPQFAGCMVMTTLLEQAGSMTQVTIMCDDIPPGIAPADNELGCRQALDNLARLAECLRGSDETDD